MKRKSHKAQKAQQKIETADKNKPKISTAAVLSR